MSDNNGIVSSPFHKEFNVSEKYGKFEYENIEHDNEEDLIINGIFGFCGCGDPWDVLFYIKESLKLIKHRPDQDLKADWIKWKTEKDKLYSGNKLAELFMLYFLDKEQLTEHGSSVYGSQLSYKGDCMLEFLNKYYSEME